MHDSPLAPVFATLRLCLHALVAILASVVIARAITGSADHRWVVVALTALWLVTYAAGRYAASWPGGPLTWLGVLSIEWLALLAYTPEASYLAFALFFLYLHLLPRPSNLIAVAAATVASVVGFAMHSGWSAAAVIGPVLGAIVAVMIAAGYSLLAAELAEREALIVQLRETQDDLAAQQRELGIHAERERLAGEIHDTVAQDLSSISMLIHAAQDVASEELPTLDLAQRATSDALAETRALIGALAPAALSGKTLADALARTTATANARGTDARFAVDGTPVVLPMPIEAALVRITQGAVANVVQHAQARNLAVTLTYSTDAIHLDVADDGIGISTPDATSPLARRRVADLGGEFTIESEPGNTVVALSFPMP